MIPKGPISGRQVEVYEEFNALGEYVWKLPNFLKDEEKRELDKLWAYFPLSDDNEVDAQNAYFRALRASSEFGLIFNTYPKAIGASCLLLVIAKFEYTLLAICRDHESTSNCELNEFRGRKRGVFRLISYLATVSDIRVDQDKLGVIKCAVMFRNCLAHADGLIDESKDSDDIRSALLSESYLMPHKRGMSEIKGYDHRPRIVSSELGDKLYVPSMYAYRICHELAELLVGVCVEAKLGRN